MALRSVSGFGMDCGVPGIRWRLDSFEATYQPFFAGNSAGICCVWVDLCHSALDASLAREHRWNYNNSADIRFSGQVLREPISAPFFYGNIL